MKTEFYVVFLLAAVLVLAFYMLGIKSITETPPAPSPYDATLSCELDYVFEGGFSPYASVRVTIRDARAVVMLTEHQGPIQEERFPLEKPDTDALFAALRSCRFFEAMHTPRTQAVADLGTTRLHVRVGEREHSLTLTTSQTASPDPDPLLGYIQGLIARARQATPM